MTSKELEIIDTGLLCDDIPVTVITDREQALCDQVTVQVCGLRVRPAARPRRLSRVVAAVPPIAQDLVEVALPLPAPLIVRRCLKQAGEEYGHGCRSQR